VQKTGWSRRASARVEDSKLSCRFRKPEKSPHRAEMNEEQLWVGKISDAMADKHVELARSEHKFLQMRV
jgi:hypothetical protein